MRMTTIADRLVVLFLAAALLALFFALPGLVTPFALTVAESEWLAAGLVALLLWWGTLHRATP